MADCLRAPRGPSDPIHVTHPTERAPSRRRALPRLAAGALAAAALSCGTSQQPAKPGGGGATKTYQPLTIKDDAKAPNQAVILGTDERNGSTVVPLPIAPSKGLVDAMFVKLAGTSPAGVTSAATGGSTPVKLETSPNADGAVQVGIYEELSGGTGPQWRAGVWVSAFVAANTLGKDLTDFTFTASSGGYIDGASASGLMAGGFLATMTGTPIDPEATMTGIINPDGTIGPVGGIPEKFAASLDKGKKRLGYPIGMRFARSEATGRPVDLLQLAKDKGAEAVEIASVYDAYRLLTGKQLPEPVPVPAQDMAVDAETTRAIDAKYKAWQARLGADWAQLLELQQAGRLPATLNTIASYAQQRAEEAEKLHKQGAIAAAYARLLVAWVYVHTATATHQVLVKAQAGDTAGAVAALGALDQIEQATGEAFKKIGAIKPKTLGGHLLMMGAYQAALRGWGFQVFAADALGTAKLQLQMMSTMSRSELASPGTAEDLAKAVAPAVVLVARAIAETALAGERLEFENEQSVSYMCSIPNVRRMSTSFQSASAAGINYFDTLLVQPLAEQSGMSLDMARQRVAMVEPDYLVAFMLSHLATWEGLPQQLKQAWGEKSLAWNLLALAGNELAYFESAELIAKYYSLNIKTDPTGRANAVEHDKAFLNMLASAERAARSSARAARIATGAIPIQAKLAYQLAAVQREGDLADKLDALAGFWTSSAFSQTAVMLARN